MRRPRRGSMLVELALSATVLVLLLAGSAAVGRGLFVYSQLWSATDAGARYAARHDTCGRDYAEQVRNVVRYGDPSPAAGQAPVVGLGRSHVRVKVERGLSGEPGEVTVAITGFALAGTWGAWRFDGRPSVTMPYFGGGSCVP